MPQQGRHPGRDDWPATVEGTLACIRYWESRGEPDPWAAINGGQYGAYQFIPSTWSTVGGTGLPIAASPEEQTLRARMLLERDGLSPWPTPSRRCRWPV